MATSRIRKITKKAVTGLRVVVSVLSDPEMKALIQRGLDASKDAAARRSVAGKADSVFNAVTNPSALLAADILLTFATKTAAPRKVQK